MKPARRSSALAICLLLVGASLAAQGKQQPFLIHVTVPEVNGFLQATKGTSESVKAIVDTLKYNPPRNRNLVRPEADRSKAAMVLVLTDRKSKSERAGNDVIALPAFGGVVASETPNYENSFWLWAELSVTPTLKQNFQCGSTRSYKDCARNLALDVIAWLEVNESRLRESPK